MSPEAVEAFETLTAAVLASEDWSPEYQHIPEAHGDLIKMIASLERKILVYFKDLNGKVPQFINWKNYDLEVSQQKQVHAAYDVNVVFNEDGLDESDQQFMKIVFDTLATAHALGAITESKRSGYHLPLGLESQGQLIQQMTTDQIANLVGKRVTPDGKIIDNPNPEMNIDETTRKKIAQSVKTSINLGENQQEATTRLRSVIADPQRASLIARNETLRAFGQGRNRFATISGATGKQWSDSNAVDVCADNTAQGIIPIGEDFVSGDEFEPAHINCKCLTRYVYRDEYDPADDDDNTTDPTEENPNE